MFNSQADFQVSIISGEKRTCKVRFPSDQEWSDRTRAQHVIEKDLGRGESIRESEGSEKADAALFEKIRQDRTEDFDEYDAQAFIERLEACEVTGVEVVGNTVRVDMLVMHRFEVSHTLRFPTKRDEAEYRRAGAFKRRIGHGYERVVVSLEPSADLWSKVKPETSGYAEGSTVPIIHKQRAISELLREVNKSPEA